MPSTRVTVTEQKGNGYDAGHPSKCPNPNGFLTDRKIAEALRRLPLNDGGRSTLEALIRRDFLLDGERKGFVYASNASLSAETGKRVRTVQLHLAKLRKWGIVRRDRKNPRKLYISYDRLFQRARMEEMLRFVSPPVTLCEGCGSEFSPRRRDQRHCNAVCRVRAQRARERAKRLMQKSVTPPAKKRNGTLTASQAALPRGGEIRCTPGVKNFSPPIPEEMPQKSARDQHFLDSTPSPKKRRLSKGKEDDNNVVQKLVTVVEVELKHPKLRWLCRRLDSLKKLLKTFSPERVLRALRQADLQYPAGRKIRNPYGLIYAMCRNLDDALLREREERERRRHKIEERIYRLRELQECGCKGCGFWDVGLDGYCSDCRPLRGVEPWRPSSVGAEVAVGS